MKNHTLTSDNAIPKRTINLNDEEIENLCKKILKWKTPTKKYKTITQRLFSSGSSTYDYFIEQAYKLTLE